MLLSIRLKLHSAESIATFLSNNFFVVVEQCVRPLCTQCVYRICTDASFCLPIFFVVIYFEMQMNHTAQLNSPNKLVSYFSLQNKNDDSNTLPKQKSSTSGLYERECFCISDYFYMLNRPVDQNFMSLPEIQVKNAALILQYSLIQIFALTTY